MAFSTGTSIIWPSFKSETGEREVEISENAFATELNISQSERAPRAGNRESEAQPRAGRMRVVPCACHSMTTQRRNQNSMREARSDVRPEQSLADYG